MGSGSLSSDWGSGQGRAGGHSGSAFLSMRQLIGSGQGAIPVPPFLLLRRRRSLGRSPGLLRLHFRAIGHPVPLHIAVEALYENWLHLGRAGLLVTALSGPPHGSQHAIGLSVSKPAALSARASSLSPVEAHETASGGGLLHRLGRQLALLSLRAVGAASTLDADEPFPQEVLLLTGREDEVRRADLARQGLVLARGDRTGWRFVGALSPAMPLGARRGPIFRSAALEARCIASKARCTAVGACPVLLHLRLHLLLLRRSPLSFQFACDSRMRQLLTIAFQPFRFLHLLSRRIAPEGCPELLSHAHL